MCDIITNISLFVGGGGGAGLVTGQFLSATFSNIYMSDLSEFDGPYSKYDGL